MPDYQEQEFSIKGVFESRRIFIGGEELLPEESFKHRNHSPDGFSWGYQGSGPAQLALAILLKFLTVSLALEWYQEFKRDFVSKLPESDFETIIPEDWLYKIELNRRNQNLWDRIRTEKKAWNQQ